MSFEQDDPRPLVSLIIPAYNEEHIIVQSLTTVLGYVDRELDPQYRFEVLVVDDGSSDRTAELAEAFAVDHPRVRVLRHPVNFRLGQALRYAFGASRGDYVVTLDCDLSYDPEHIGRMLEALRVNYARVVVASPYMKGGRTTAIPRGREMMSRGANRLLAASSQDGISTLTGMVRAYDGPFLRSLNLKAMGPEINTEILYKAKILRARVVEVPAHLDWTGQAERAKTRRVNLKVKPTTKLYLFSSFIYRPLAFFVVPGLAVMVLAVWTLLSIAFDTLRLVDDLDGGIDARLTEAFEQVYAQRPQSFIIGGISLVLSVQLISFGLLSLQSKRYFEELFHLGTRVVRGVERP